MIPRNSVVTQLLFLAAKTREKIYLYINSPGGSVTAGWQFMINEFNFTTGMYYLSWTCCFNGCSSSQVVKKEDDMPYLIVKVLIHQPLGGAQGQATEIQIAAKHIIRIVNVSIKF